MSIRHALPADVDTLADIEAASYPPAEGASRQSIAGRVAVYPDCFWLLDEGGEVKAFVNGFVTDMPDLTDEMYDDPIFTRRRWVADDIQRRHRPGPSARRLCLPPAASGLRRRESRRAQGHRAHLQGTAHRLLCAVRLRG